MAAMLQCVAILPAGPVIENSTLWVQRPLRAVLPVTGSGLVPLPALQLPRAVTARIPARKPALFSCPNREGPAGRASGAARPNGGPRGSRPLPHPRALCCTRAGGRGGDTGWAGRKQPIALKRNKQDAWGKGPVDCRVAQPTTGAQQAARAAPAIKPHPLGDLDGKCSAVACWANGAGVAGTPADIGVTSCCLERQLGFAMP